MPFTGSHPAAVLPLLRLGLVPSALVIGSMAPDTPYYLPVPLSAGLTHSALGTVTADVALGGVLFAIWHGLLARFAAAVPPAPVRARLGPARPVTMRAAPLVALSLAAGAATHVLWDAFTHPGRWGTAHIGWLARTHHGLPGYGWAQYTSGVLGAAAIGAWLLRWWRTTPPVIRPGARNAALAWAVIGLAGVAGALIAAIPAAATEPPLRIVFLAGTGAVGAGLAAAVLCSVRQVRHRRPPPEAAGEDRAALGPVHDE